MKRFIKENPQLKKIVHWLLIPTGQARPRTWVQWFVNPWFHKKGKGARICTMTRIDVLPFNDFVMGHGATIEDFSTINNGVGPVYIGNRSRVGLGNTLIGPVTLEEDVRLGQNCVLSGLNHNYEDISRPIHEQGVTTKMIVIKKGAWLGANVTILPGISVGENAVVAAGSVVTKNVPDFSIVAGNPARVMKQFNKETWEWERVKQETKLVLI